MAMNRTTIDPLSFAELARLEPRLGQLLAEVRTRRMSVMAAMAKVPELVGPKRQDRGHKRLFDINSLLEVRVVIFNRNANSLNAGHPKDRLSVVLPSRASINETQHHGN